MSRDTPRWIRRAAALCVVASLAACQKDQFKTGDGDGGVRAMDGLERYTARTVSIETATDAIQQRDVKKLKMLAVWVRKRDKTALLSEDDLNALDLAIDCLEGNKSANERRDALDEIKTGKLKAPAREVCLEDTD